MKIRPARATVSHAGGWTEGKADTTKLRVAFRNSARAPKKQYWHLGMARQSHN